MPGLTAPQVLDVAIKAADAYDRTDLALRLRQSRDRARTSEIRVLVAGEFKQGKSQLVNALITAPVCPVADDIATAVPTIVRYARHPEAFVVREGGSREAVPIDRLSDHVLTSGVASHVEAGVPRAVLADGLTIVDTPGVGGLASAPGAATMAALAIADAVLFVSDAAQEYTATELEFLRQARQLCPNVVCVLTKTDLYRSWRDVADLDRAQLAEAGVLTELIPVSSVLRLHAASTDDAELNRESGFPALVRFLRDGLVARAGDLARRSVAHDVLTVAQQLSGTMTAELAARHDPTQARALVAELEETGRRSDELRQRSARWQQTLNDGIADLIADIDYDLRDRLRDVVRVAETELDAVDPAKVGDEFADWLRQKELACTSATFVWMMERARWLATQVADHFADSRLPRIRPGTELGTTLEGFELAPAEKFGIGQKLIVGMRGGYGGTLMIGMLSTIAGIAMINPLSVGAGLLLGGKTVHEERKRLLQRRQAEAKAAVRKHVDDVIFQAGKQSRDLLREIQRTLRDHFTEHAEQVHRSLADALTAARDAVRSDESERAARIRDLKAELVRVRNLERLARELAA
ncbi:MAG: dynamin family protein [Kibdelosporangium sp.]